jgi:hypothetical protein
VCLAEEDEMNEIPKQVHAKMVRFCFFVIPNLFRDLEFKVKATACGFFILWSDSRILFWGIA